MLLQQVKLFGTWIPGERGMGVMEGQKNFEPDKYGRMIWIYLGLPPPFFSIMLVILYFSMGQVLMETHFLSLPIKIK